ncbi:glycogen debranching N-terminal domain-containing protein [Luteimonas sp. R10]|uniref:amylo-alpha-1,6-glucosidase n=1 Tax=Luteimonas sp. R10 TaxID=3108176 RepID=UPI00308F6FDD|nr:amylo-alpha-1,6-glucosidase [Luteimonas sp. R10]
MQPVSRQVLKDGDSYLVADTAGDIHGGADGLFHNDTRLLSVFRLSLNECRPELLSGSIVSDNVRFIAHLSSRPLPEIGNAASTRTGVHVERMRLLFGERLYERLVCTNYGQQDEPLVLRLDYAADFRDMFEVRGSVRAARGQILPPRVLDERGVALRYRGLDGGLRESVIAFSRTPQRLAPDHAEFEFALPAGGSETVYLEVGAVSGNPSKRGFDEAMVRARLGMRARRRRGANARSSARSFNDWLEQSRSDLALLTSELDSGPYPFAGIPWFSTPFGRDAVVTALQTLWLDPALSRGVLEFLARHQAQEESTFRDAVPGKIMHETRKGEMAVLRELPFGLYYGGVDTTPLFVVLAGAYAERTGDLAFVEHLWPALLAATALMERVCDGNPAGLLDYARGESSGLSNQGWKDSDDSVFHADGRMPDGPIALVEVQGYVFAGLRMMAGLALRFGDNALAERLRQRAQTLRRTVEDRFWMPEHGFYGLALDGEQALCRVRASNAGHLLYAGLPGRRRAAAVTRTLLSPAFDSGWGVRTLAEGEVRYNPMSYHNGSVWPHDTALVAAGMARYGHREGAERLLQGMFAAATHFDFRLPELFCGFARTGGIAPVPYPVACLPQAWAAGSVFMLLQSCLGLSVDARRGRIVVDHPRLPAGVDHVLIRGLALGPRKVDLRVLRVGDRIGVFSEGRDAQAVPVLLRG